MSEAALARPEADVQPQGAGPVLGRASGLRLHRRCACGGDAGIGGECESCRATTLQRRGDGHGAPAGLPASVGRTLAQSGRPLDGAARSFMEPRFGADFSAVRVHDDSGAAASARDVHALAYTVGQDIVFASGQYQPGTESGRHLLAHELAHTVQQRGLQRSGTAALPDQGPEYRRLEAEADRAADAVLAGSRARPLSSVGRPVLSRTPTPTPTSTPTATATAAAAAQSLTVDSGPMGQLVFNVTPAGDHGDPSGGSASRQRRYDVDIFYLPGTKGDRALTLYDGRARARQLQATLQIVGTAARRTATWETRANPEALGESWVRSVGWSAAGRDPNWSCLAGGAAFTQTSVPGNGTCNIDHIVELQLQGGNDPQNLQALDAVPNQSAGGAIWSQVSGLGTRVAEAFSVPSGDQVQLVFRSAVLRGAVWPSASTAGQPRNCLMIDRAAREGTESCLGAAAGPAARTVTLAGGASQNDFVVPADWGANNRNAPLFDEPANRAAAQMLSGFQLRELQFRDNRQARVVARIDERAGRRGTRLPLTLSSARGDDIQINAARTAVGAAVVYRMTLPRTLPTNFAFNYDFLSPGTIKQISFTEAGELNWRGEIRTGVPFLPNPLLVIYENDSLRLAVELGPRQLRSPIPGFTLTDGNLSLTLAPTLQASGHLGFAIGRGASAIATGAIDVVADGSGLSATGLLQAHIPGVDTAEGRVEYRNGVVTGQIVIESSQIRLPNVQRGRLQLDIDSTGLRPSGELELLLPRDLGNVTLGFSREGSRFVYTGRGRLRVPGLHEVDIRARYDGVNLHAEASNIGFRWHGLDGSIDVAYDARGEAAGRISGRGRLTLQRGDVTGSIEVQLHDSGRFSGHGRVTYPFTIQGQRIEASAGVIVNEDQSVRVEGALRFPQPIQLFRRFGDNRQLFHFQRNIPIPGLSIGPVGVVAVIEGGVSAHYGFGPGELRNVSLEAAFNPLAEHIDPNVAFHAELHVPADAGITGTIGGGLGVEAGIARVNGTLTVSASLNLNAVLGGPLDLRYAERKFSVSARPGIDASLNLGLSLDAHARAEAGVGPFTVGVEKSWNLGRRAIVLGSFSMHAPIAWSSDAGFTAPSIDQIEWGPMPEIDPGDLLSQLFRSSSAEERET